MAHILRDIVPLNLISVNIQPAEDKITSELKENYNVKYNYLWPKGTINFAIFTETDKIYCI
jgi:hypothetical protein